MSLFRKKDEHAGSGIDKPEPKGIVETVAEKVADTVKAATAPAIPATPKPPAAS